MRHAYHSPDMILKIRRANEAAAERKGSGVPWRHRLGTSERREFVMSEIRHPRAGRERSRGSELDIQRAVLAARNPKESKFGECLINVNTKQDPILKLRLGRITTEMRRMEFRMQQVKQHFMKTNPCLNHEPLILVERPASPQVRRRAKVIQVSGEDPNDLKLPGYMRPLRSQCKTPSTLTTIDAFTLRTKKKRNVWEEAMDDKEPPRFRSTVRPSAKLTRREMAALQVGWDAHKPRLDLDPKDKAKAEGQGHHRPLREAIANTPFVTQLPRKELPQTSDGRLLKSVVLDQLAGTSQSPPPPPPPPPPNKAESVGAAAAAEEEEQKTPPAASGENGAGAADAEDVGAEKAESVVEEENDESASGAEKADDVESTEKADDVESTAKAEETVGEEKAESTTQRRRKVAIVEKPFFITQSSD